MRNTSRCSFLTSNEMRTLHSGTSNFTECTSAVKRCAMRVGQNDIIWTFFMPITSILLRAQVLLPENDKRKKKYKRVPSWLVILILSNSIFHFINPGVPVRQISGKKQVTLMMKWIWLNRFLNIPLILKCFINSLKLGRNLSDTCDTFMVLELANCFNEASAAWEPHLMKE